VRGGGQRGARHTASPVPGTSRPHARAQGLRVRPLCPFIAHVIEQNPEYQELLEG